MGSCVSKKSQKSNGPANPRALSNPVKSNETSENQPGIYIPEFPYFNRSEGKVYLVKSEDIIEISFNQLKPFALESALCFLSTQFLLIIGGTVNGELVKEVSLLDIKSKSSKECAPLPMASKQGQAHQIDDWVYYIGGLQVKLPSTTEPTPLMRYNLKENTWQSLFIEGEQFGFNKLFSMGTCVLAGKILIVGGHRINSQNETKNNKTIYSIDPKAGFQVKSEGKIPFKVKRPLISSQNNWAVVAGGHNSKNFGPNYLSCIIEVNGNEFEVSRVQDTFINLIENYPTFNDGNLAVMVKYPQIQIFNYKKRNWSSIEITGKNTRKVSEINSRITVVYDDLSSDDSAKIGKKKEFKRMETKEGELLRSVFRKKTDQEKIEDKKNGEIEEGKLKLSFKIDNGKIDKEGKSEPNVKIEDKNIHKDEEVKQNIKLGNGFSAKDREIDSDSKSDKSSSSGSSSSGESSSSGSSGSSSDQSSDSKIINHKQKAVPPILMKPPVPVPILAPNLFQNPPAPYSNSGINLPSFSNPNDLKPPSQPQLPPTPFLANKLELPPTPISVNNSQLPPTPFLVSNPPLPPTPSLANNPALPPTPISVNNPQLPPTPFLVSNPPLPPTPFLVNNPPVLLTAIPESDSDIEEIQIKKSPNVPLLNLEPRFEDPVISFSANIDIQPEPLRVSTPKAGKSSAMHVPELKLRPNTIDYNPNPKLIFRGKLKPLTVKEFKPYLASKTFKGSLNYLRSPDKQETYKNFRSAYLSPEQKSKFMRNFDDIKTTRVNLFGTSPQSSKPDIKIKISYSKLFPEENVQKLSNLIFIEFAKPCKLVPVIDSFLSLKEFLSENLNGTLITIENFNHILIGITLILGKKAFTKKQISYISSKSQLIQDQFNLSHDQFCLGVYKAYKVALFKKT